MSFPILAMLLTAALFHATWNFLLKQIDDRLPVTWWAMAISSVASLPVLLLSLPLPPRIWIYALSSALFEAAYVVILVSAYRRGDFSVVYPIARGAAPGLLAIWAVLALGETLSAGGVLGLVVLVAGLMLTGSSALWQQERKAASPWSVLLALAVALCISLYSIIDGAAVRVMSPAPYTVLAFGLTTLALTPFVLYSFGPRAILGSWRVHWRRSILIGGLTLGSYMLVLAVYALAPVSYAGAVREVSIVFAALFGWLWLGERFGAVRLAGAAVIVSGVLIVALAG